MKGRIITLALVALGIASNVTAQLVAFPVGHFSAGDVAGPFGTTHYFEVTVQNTKIGSTLTNFPVYVDLSDAPSGFWSHVSAGGANVRVYNANATIEMPREVVHIDTIGGDTGELYFEADSISASSDTTFRIYYGGSASAPSTSDSHGRDAVWANGFAAVYHLSEADPGSDTVANAVGSTSLDMTDLGSMTSADAVAGELGATGEPSAFDFDGTDDALEVDSIAVSGFPVTITAIMKANEVGGISKVITGIADKDVPSDYILLATRDDQSDQLQLVTRNNAANIVTDGTSDIVDGAYHHVAATVSASVSEIFVDGASETTNTTTHTFPDTPDRTSVGRTGDSSPGLHWDGEIDEVRWSTVVRSDDWISAEYENLMNPATFYSVGVDVEL